MIVNILYKVIVFSCALTVVLAYSNNLYAIEPHKYGASLDADCDGIQDIITLKKVKLNAAKIQHNVRPLKEIDFTFQTIRTTTRSTQDPFLVFQKTKLQILLGSRPKVADEEFVEKVSLNLVDDSEAEDDLILYPSGNIMHGELFMNKSAVHIPMLEMIHRDHSLLRLTDDYMQTAVDAFAIFLTGSVEDVYQLPSSYVLKSARTIAMMNIEREKLVATWTVVKGDLQPDEISFQVLEMYRPLFKYLSGREIARLNLSDDRILNYIGTHADLDRHQVGVTAAKYIRMNPNWSQPHYLNLMNNLLCGVPMSFMRKLGEAIFLQLTQQVFYHIRACDPLQIRFYLTMMTKTQALGKSYSWNARDVSRLGLLLTQVAGPDLAAVNPEAMAGITSQVMLEMPAANLKYVTEMQLRYLGQKPLNILAKRLREYREKFTLTGSTGHLVGSGLQCILGIICLGKIINHII